MHDDLVDVLIKKIDDLDAKLDKHTQEISELLDAWKTAKGIAGFVRVTAGVLAAIALSWAWVTSYFTIGVKP